MSTAGCTGFINDPALGFVDTGYSALMSKADAAFGISLNTYQQLINFQPGSQPVNVSYVFDASILGYQRPNSPGTFVDTFVLPAGDPGLPPPLLAQRPNFDFNAPVLTVSPPTISFPQDPGSLTAVLPGGPPVLFDVILPPVPIVTLPMVPVPNTILPLPLDPTIVLPNFGGVRPDFNVPVPIPNVGFTPVLYTSQLLTDVRAKLDSMLQGGTGLPADVEQALINRAVAREDEGNLRLVRETIDEFATMGYSEPEGVLGLKLMVVRQDAQDKRASLSRDIYVKAIDIQIENLRFSITQGVAIESVMLQNWMQYQGLILESQKLVLQVALELTNVRITIFNAQLAQYQTDASVYKELIEGALAQLEIYKAKLEAKKLILGINQQEIDLYLAQLKGVMTMIDLYKSQLEGVHEIVEINTLRLEGYKTNVQVYTEQVRAYQAQWEGYKAAAEAQGVKASIYDVSIKAYLGQVQAWSAKNSSYAELGKFDIELDRNHIDGWKAQLQGFLTEIDANLKVFEAKEKTYEANTRVYQAQASVEQAATESNSRVFELGMRREDNRAQIALKNLELAIKELLENSAQLLEAKKAVGQGAGQLAASAMSSLHFGASLSSSLSQGSSCSTAYSYNTDLLPAA